MGWGLSLGLWVNGALQGSGIYHGGAESPTEASETQSCNLKSRVYRKEIISLNEWRL